MRSLNRMTDLIILNILTIFACLPVLTAGAAFTALHYVLRKMADGEEGRIASQYFRAFRESFRAATAVWLMLAVPLGIGAADLLLLASGAAGLPAAAAVLLACTIAALCLFLYCVSLYAFPLLARFDESARETLKNAAILVFAALPRSAAMAAVTLFCPALWILYPVCSPLLFLCGISVPAYLCVLLYVPVFRRLEESAAGRGKNARE